MNKNEYKQSVSQAYLIEPLPLEKNRILIVDDEKLVRDVFKLVLSYGLPKCKTDFAVNGAEAIESFRAIHQGVILMDLMMPVMDGETAFDEIQKICRTNNWEMPSVVFCTGYVPTDKIKNTVKDNTSHCLLQKPVSNDVLIKAINIRLAA